MDRLRGSFQRQAIPMTWDYAEAHPIANTGGGFGATLHSEVEVLDVRSGDGEGADKSWGRPQQRGVSVENFGMGDPLYHDAERLKVLVERHLLHTGSAKAKALLDDWTSELGNFRKVMPRDYQRALKALEDEREQAAMEAAE